MFDKKKPNHDCRDSLSSVWDHSNSAHATNMRQNIQIVYKYNVCVHYLNDPSN